jgi:hypothetical protein
MEGLEEPLLGHNTWDDAFLLLWKGKRDPNSKCHVKVEAVESARHERGSTPQACDCEVVWCMLHRSARSDTPNVALVGTDTHLTDSEKGDVAGENSNQNMRNLDEKEGPFHHGRQGALHHL